MDRKTEGKGGNPVQEIPGSERCILLCPEAGKIFTDYKDRDVARAKLALWYNEIEEYGYETFTTVANSIENHYERILNYFVNRSTNAAAEAFNAKIKAFRASFRGVVDTRFFLFRLANVYA